jgi:transmembrane sensor
MKASDPVASGEPDDAISRRAADFFERRRFGEWSDADQAELDAWVSESALQRAAYLRVEGIAAYTQKLASLRPPRPVRSMSGIAGKLMHRRLLLPLLAAASITLAAVLGTPFVISLMQPPDRTYSTEVGGHVLVNFADRTQIELNTDSVVRCRMTNQERTVWLEKGEAWFRVSHDAAHPFTVIVGKHRITDLGTEFMVRRGSDGMEVALLNGRATLSADSAQAAVLTPGDDAIATPNALSVTRKTPQELADALAWRHGVLVFRNTNLADVVREFNRYNQTKLVIADPSIAGIKVSTDLRADDVESFVQLAQAVLNLRADREGNEILISRRSREETKRAGRVKHGD